MRKNVKDTIDITQHYSPAFELTVQLKDSTGKPTGRTKTIATDDAGKLAHFWHRHKAPLRKKRSKITPTDKEGQKIMNEMYGDK